MTLLRLMGRGRMRHWLSMGGRHAHFSGFFFFGFFVQADRPDNSPDPTDDEDG